MFLGHQQKVVKRDQGVTGFAEGLIDLPQVSGGEPGNSGNAPEIRPGYAELFAGFTGEGLLSCLSCGACHGRSPWSRIETMIA